MKIIKEQFPKVIYLTEKTHISKLTNDPNGLETV